jgi:hypothetical protein
MLYFNFGARTRAGAASRWGCDSKNLMWPLAAPAPHYWYKLWCKIYLKSPHILYCLECPLQ